MDVADIWFDGNNDGFNNDQPVIKNCASTNECYLYISTAGVNSAGDYNLYAETPFGGRAVSVVHISQSRTRGLVPDLVKPTIMPLIANNSSTETGNLDEPAVESGEVEDDKPEENDVDNSITESETTDCMPDKTNETDEANEPLKSDESNPSSMTNDDDKLTTATPLIDDSSSVELVDGSIEGLLDSAGGVDINDNT